MNRYSYAELKSAATAPNAEQSDINALGKWFEEYGDAYWNGEYFDAEGDRLYSVTVWDDENDCGEIVGYEMR